jgi:VanZ family protein
MGGASSAAFPIKSFYFLLENSIKKGRLNMTVQRKWTDASWRALWIAASAAVAVLIFLFSAQTAPESNETSKGVLYWLLSLLRLTPYQMTALTNHFIRKAAHFTVYALLGFCLTGLYHHQSRIPKAPAAIVTAALYAVTDELHQSFVPGRGPMLTDVLLDTGGAALGVLVMALLLRVLYRRRG